MTDHEEAADDGSVRVTPHLHAGPAIIVRPPAVRTPEECAAAIDKAAAGMLAALDAAGIGNDVNLCLAAIGGVAGCVARGTGQPAQAMEAINILAQGIIDGSLLD